MGGVREKILGARRAGIRKIILPERNREDVEEIPEEYRAGLTFVYVDTVEEALMEVVGRKKNSGKRKSRKKRT